MCVVWGFVLVLRRTFVALKVDKHKKTKFMDIDIMSPNAKTIEVGNKEVQKFLKCGFGVLVLLVCSVVFCVYFYGRCASVEAQIIDERLEHTSDLRKNTEFIQNLILTTKK